jgi:hypothetical protein
VGQSRFGPFEGANERLRGLELVLRVDDELFNRERGAFVADPDSDF